MRIILDSSAIFYFFKNGDIKKISDCMTTSLAQYELGNILWKEYNLHKRITAEELSKAISNIEELLSAIDTIDIKNRLDDIVKTATKLNITFYDASYVFLCKDIGATLVTTDEKLIKKARNFVEIIHPREL
jgi:predicted nucleic acid-binding protein